MLRGPHTCSEGRADARVDTRTPGCTHTRMPNRPHKHACTHARMHTHMRTHVRTGMPVHACSNTFYLVKHVPDTRTDLADFGTIARC